MTESLHLEVELPPRPIGTRLTWQRGKSTYPAEIVGYYVQHDTDTGNTFVSYRIAYDYAGQRIVNDVPRVTVERALGGES